MASTIRLEIVTIEGKIFDDDVSMVIAPGSEGVLGILPQHTALLTALNYGELQVKKEGEPDQFFAIGGGFLEVQPHHVVVLADAAERADEIDLARAEESRKRAEELLTQAKDGQVDFKQAESALRHSMARIKVARRRTRGEGYMGQRPDSRNE